MGNRIGVIIPCFNEEKYIEACLMSIIKASGGEHVDIAVVDGLSEDGTRTVISNLQKNYPQILCLDNEKRTAPFAMNIGIKALDNPFKVIIGAHSVVDTNFFEANLRVLDQNPEVVCSGGQCENVYENEDSEAIGAAMASKFGVGDVRFRTGGQEGYVDTVAFGAYRQTAFDQIGLFDESLTRNQDDELNYRITNAGLKIFYSDTIKYRYHVRASFKKLFKQYYQYGYWKVIVNRKHKTITTVRQVVPALFVAYLIVQFTALFFLPWAKIGLFILLAYVVLALVSAVKSGSRSPLKVFWAFLILHFSYGIGYLHGLLSFGREKEVSISR